MELFTLQWVQRTSGGCKDLTRPNSHNLHFKITELARRFNPETVLRQNALLLYNRKECREGKKKVCPFFLLENSRPFSPWGPLDFLSTCLGNDSLKLSSSFPYLLQFKSEFGNKELMFWATVSSWFCFCWLYRASPSLAAKNKISLVSVLTIWWCPCVESCYDQCILLAKLY